MPSLSRPPLYLQGRARGRQSRLEQADKQKRRAVLTSLTKSNFYRVSLIVRVKTDTYPAFYPGLIERGPESLEIFAILPEVAPDQKKCHRKNHDCGQERKVLFHCVSGNYGMWGRTGASDSFICMLFVVDLRLLLYC